MKIERDQNDAKEKLFDVLAGLEQDFMDSKTYGEQFQIAKQWLGVATVLQDMGEIEFQI
ncbi:hypothetical protein ACEN19_11105 [Corynebacterium auriscanis]|uniref:hypothetical protein n=1 Tax=Corynebacterium auriscanis TaxID=99807 RepID=UPI003CE8AFE4